MGVKEGRGKERKKGQGKGEEGNHNRYISLLV